jgi:hypothetical protein
MPAFTPDQWLVLGLVFLLGLVVGMMLTAGGKWKRRYRDEAAQRAELEREIIRLKKDEAEMDTLRQAAARDEARRRTEGPGPL